MKQRLKERLFFLLVILLVIFLGNHIAASVIPLLRYATLSEILTVAGIILGAGLSLGLVIYFRARGRVRRKVLDGLMTQVALARQRPPKDAVNDCAEQHPLTSRE